MFLPRADDTSGNPGGLRLQIREHCELGLSSAVGLELEIGGPVHAPGAGLHSQYQRSQPGGLVHTFNPSSWEVEAGGFKVILGNTAGS